MAQLIDKTVLTRPGAGKRRLFPFEAAPVADPGPFRRPRLASDAQPRFGNRRPANFPRGKLSRHPFLATYWLNPVK